MPRVKKLDLGMTALDELFMNDKERAENKLPKIFDIPLSEIDDFPGHPYRVLDDEDMQNLMESIKDRGVITPAMVRKKDDGRYEMISGHRRKHASERLGLETLRCEVVEVSRDEAIILMVDSNAQRSVILPCDKGRAYKMKLEAIKRQGQRTDLTSTPLGEKLEGKDALSVTQISNESGESQTQIQRYIRLTYLVDELQDFVDKGQMKMRPAVELSYVRADAIEQVVMLELRRMAEFLVADEEAFTELLAQKTDKELLKEKKHDEAELQKAIVRNDTVSHLYKKLYEDNAVGKVSDEWFMQLSHKYETERLELKTKIKTLRQKLSECGQREQERESFTSAIRRFMRMDRLTAPLLRELIDHIDVFETEGKGKNRTQRIVIYYRFIGYVEIPEILRKPDIIADTRKGVATKYLTEPKTA